MIVVVKQLGLRLGLGNGKGNRQYNLTGHNLAHITFSHEGVLPIKQKNDQVDSDNNKMGESNMIKEKVTNNP